MDLPKYIAMHGPGNGGIVLKRCSTDACYDEYAKTANIFGARELADKLNKAERAT